MFVAYKGVFSWVLDWRGNLFRFILRFFSDQNHFIESFGYLAKFSLGQLESSKTSKMLFLVSSWFT
jgi:hypothetical protein